MTAVAIASVYLLVLGFFLGLDMVPKVPATLYGLALAAFGTFSGVALVGGLALGARSTSVDTGRLSLVAAGLASAAAVGGLVAFGRLVRAFRRKTRA